MKEFISCNKCDNGFIYHKDGNYVTKCSCLKNYQKKEKLKLKLDLANIPESIIDYSIKNYIGKDKNDNISKLKKFIKEFKEKFFDKILYFYGNQGTQKTTIAYWMGRELLKNDINVKYILMNDLIKELQKESFEENVSIDKYLNSDLLIIDRSFVKDQVTIYNSKYQLPFLDNFLRKRLEQLCLSTIIISNKHIDFISKNGFNEDIEDLIRRKTVVYNSVFLFEDSYLLKDDFDVANLWSDDIEN